MQRWRSSIAVIRNDDVILRLIDQPADGFSDLWLHRKSGSSIIHDVVYVPDEDYFFKDRFDLLVGGLRHHFCSNSLVNGFMVAKKEDWVAFDVLQIGHWKHFLEYVKGCLVLKDGYCILWRLL
jgi:hypothetical protein